ncbi:hypothetical protein CH296_05645 [Rhodococcus sp. 14-2496-1d]|nr:hypothetical protein CH301_05845 [Rhodococcus sp. 15-1189-1-1a]OZF18683.1 hypothetical protein CH299_06390 [Rhodococcus sp. 14-2686-1-2]OZF36579.1 hypothetical protein CH296_05645 [Rhodococcus sp. 14-2496-1d]OZF42125.1 hypothetical protein CH293_26885 [Rhodococcus sp. 14-2470-1b]
MSFGMIDVPEWAVPIASGNLLVSHHNITDTGVGTANSTMERDQIWERGPDCTRARRDRHDHCSRGIDNRGAPAPLERAHVLSQPYPWLHTRTLTIYRTPL